MAAVLNHFPRYRYSRLFDCSPVSPGASYLSVHMYNVTEYTTLRLLCQWLATMLSFWYTVSMSNETPAAERTAIERYDDVRKTEILLRVLRYQTDNPRASRVDACEAVGIPDRTLRHWLSQGILDDYLAEFAAAMSKEGRGILLERWSKILHYQGELASGSKIVKGANPTSAAEFCRKVAGVEFAVKERAPSIGEMNLFMLPQAHFIVRDGKPQLESEDIVDGEFEEVGPSEDSSPSP